MLKGYLNQGSAAFYKSQANFSIKYCSRAANFQNVCSNQYKNTIFNLKNDKISYNRALVISKS